MIMTLRSPKRAHKSSTFSYKSRNRRHHQQLLPQPPRLRAHRAATPEDSQPTAWAPTTHDTLTRTDTSHPAAFTQTPNSGYYPSRHLQQQQQQQQQPPPPPPKATPESGSHIHTATDDFHLRISADPESFDNSPLEIQDMSTLGFMMAPAPYGMDHYASSHQMESPSGYPPMTTPYTESKYSSSPSFNNSTYAQSHSTPRRSAELSPLPSYQPSSMPRSPYQHAMGPARTSPSALHYSTSTGDGASMLTSAPQNYSYPAMHSSLPGQPLGSNTSSYPPPSSYPPTSSYGDYTPIPTSLYPTTTSPASYSLYEQPSNLVPQAPATHSDHGSTQGAQPNGLAPRVLNSRPKPQCWDHGCNGRQFSTFSNLLRHQREKSGTATKSSCPRCGAEFTRTTARNGHLAHEKCKPRMASDARR